MKAALKKALLLSAVPLGQLQVASHLVVLPTPKTSEKPQLHQQQQRRDRPLPFSLDYHFCEISQNLKTVRLPHQQVLNFLLNFSEEDSTAIPENTDKKAGNVTADAFLPGGLYRLPVHTCSVQHDAIIRSPLRQRCINCLLFQ